MLTTKELLKILLFFIISKKLTVVRKNFSLPFMKTKHQFFMKLGA